VCLARSGRVIPVAPGENMLNALREAGVDVPSSCEGGVCVECKTRFLDGMPVHRDLVMGAADRRQYVTPCVPVARGRSSSLTYDWAAGAPNDVLCSCATPNPHEFRLQASGNGLVFKPQF
jgi:hypothetical protein